MEVFETLAGWLSEKVVSDRNKRFENESKNNCFADAVRQSKNKTIQLREKYSTAIIKNQQKLLELSEAERLMSEIKARDLELEKSRIYWSNTFDAISDCVFIIDNNRVILQGNKAFLKTFNITPNVFGKLHCFDVISTCSDYCAESCKRFWIYSPKTIDTIDIAVGNGELKQRKFVISSNPIFDSDGNHYASVIILRDVIDLKEVELLEN